MKIIGYVALALVSVQVYYIILHYDNITKYVDRYKNYRYGIDIVPQYIDPTTTDYNDTVVSNVKSKRRCVNQGNNTYVIVSNNGYAVNDRSNLLTYPSLINCIIDMTDNYPNMLLNNPCVNPYSSACYTMLALL